MSFQKLQSKKPLLRETGSLFYAYAGVVLFYKYDGMEVKENNNTHINIDCVVTLLFLLID